jgi:hypothetical protein
METIGQVSVSDPEARPGPRGIVVAGAGAGLILSALVWWLMADWAFWSGPALLGGAALLVGPFQWARRNAQRRRNRDVLTAWGGPRGLAYAPGAGNPSTTPLLKRKGGLGPALVGSVGGDPQGVLAHYTYTVGSGKNQHTVKLSVAMARFEGRDGLRVVVRDGWQVGFEGLFDDWSAFETQSAEVDDRFEIEVREGHDPVQVTELLDPVVLASLLAGEQHPLVEVDAGTLVVAIGGHVGIDPGVEDLAWFEFLRARADQWGARIAGI